MPKLLLAATSLFFFLLSFVFALIIRIFAFFVRTRIFYRDTFTITIWSAAPMLMLLPVAIVLIRVLVFSPSINWLIFILLGLISLWILFRSLKATSVVFDITAFRVYLIGFGLIASLATSVIAMYQFNYSIFAYGGALIDIVAKF